MSAAKTQIEFGKQLRDLFYNLTPSITFLNHGSYGSAPKPVLDKKRKLQDEMESFPDMWFRQSLYDSWLKNLTSLANYLGVNADNLLIGENATDCINVVCKSIEFEGARDAILTNNLEYSAIRYALEYTSKYRFAASNQVHLHTLNINLPVTSKDELLQMFNKACAEIVVQKKLRLRFAVIDHITSGTAILMPVAEINQIIRRWAPDCKILIDGAHSIGQIKLDFASYGCDYYVSNLHKWFFAPRSCSFIYTTNANNFQDPAFQPNYISIGYKNGLWQNFCQRGTTDKTSWYVVDDCVRFYEEYLGGFERISGYCSDLASRVLVMLEDGWKTKRLGVPADCEAPFMKIIKLPYMKNYVIGPEPADQVSSRLMSDLISKFQLFALPVVLDQQLYVRISCFVYNSFEDFVKLRDAILTLASSDLLSDDDRIEDEYAIIDKISAEVA